MSTARKPFLSAIAALGAAALAIGVAQPATAVPSASAPVIINEVYGGGGNFGSLFDRDFIELYNPTDAAVPLTGMAVQYASATGATWQVTTLTGSIPAHGYYLVAEALSVANPAPALPTPDVTGGILMSATAGKVALTSSTTALACGAGCATLPEVVDLVGFGATANSFAGTGPTPAPSSSTSVSRTAGHPNTPNNATDFVSGTPTPQNTSTPPDGPVDPPVDPVELSIADIQGTGSASTHIGKTVITTGVVTAAYPTGGFNGYVIQTPGTGGVIDLATHTASDAIFVFSSSTVGLVAIGNTVKVTGAVSEFNTLTEITVTSAAGLEVLPAATPVTPATVAWPAGAAQRESLESMLVAPSGAFTVTNTFATNSFAEVGLAAGDHPLLTPTEVGAPGSSQALDQVADNAARLVTLDDGASIGFLSAANQSLTPPYLSLTSPVRVGASVTFTQPVIVDFRNNVWKLNPTAQYVAGGTAPVAFENDRTAAPSDVGGDLKVASFNVLNYFTSLGEDFALCTSFNDRTGDPVTVNSCPGTGPRGAFEDEDLARQQVKIVEAINALDADVVGLLEIENSAVVDGVPDEALATLVTALNADAGAGTWAYVPSSTELPATALQDVITNALIYRPAAVERVGDSRALGTESTEPAGAFQNAREPIGQEFAPLGGGDEFFVAVNHFKSKGSAGPWPGDADTGDGQGASNESRERQATALRDWILTVTDPGEAVALVGDFNSYTHEDPLQLLYDAGYADAASEFAPGQYSYSFSGESGSLDHVLLNAPALGRATGTDIWEINAEESIALEYSRFNYHGTLFYAEDPYRSSDHDPVIVGLDDGRPLSSTTLTASKATLKAGTGQSSKLTATVTVGGTAATGQVEFLVDGVLAQTLTLNKSGKATFTLGATPTASSRVVVAHYVGTPDANESDATPVTIVTSR